MAGKIGHNPLFLPVEPGIFRLPASLVENPPAISFCEYEMRSVVVREVISDWYDDTTGKVDSNLNTLNDGTREYYIFYFL